MEDDNGSDDDTHPLHPNRRRNGQIKPEHTLNLGGRPRGARSTKKIMQEILSSPVFMTVDGKVRKVSLLRAMGLRFKQEVLTGPIRALERGLAVAEKYSPDELPDKLVLDHSKLTMDESREFLRLMKLIRGDRYSGKIKHGSRRTDKDGLDTDEEES